MRSLYCLCAIFFAFSALASTSYPKQQNRANKFFEFIAEHPALRQYAFYSLISNRCLRYMPYEVRACNKSVLEQIKILDFEIIFLNNKGIPISPYVFVAFKKHLITMLKSPSTTTYLTALGDRLGQYQKDKRFQFNLWAMTQEYFPDPYDSAKIIATLFQDTSSAKLHLAYLEKVRLKEGSIFEKNRELLAKTIADLNLITDYSGEDFPKIFYPANLPTIFTRAIYHFYVPLYLSMELRRKGIETEFARSAPIMMTLTYEFITKAPDYRYVFQDPTYLSPKENEAKIQDIHASYISAHWGSDSRGSRLSFAALKELFYGTVKNAVFDILYL